MERKGFIFCNEETDFSEVDCFVAYLPKKIQGQEELFNAYYDVMNFPGWFGFNWNALNDNLCGLEWINKRIIVIIHQDLPQLSNSEIQIYLDILFDAINFWEIHEDHKLEVAFPISTKSQIDKLMAELKLQ